MYSTKLTSRAPYFWLRAFVQLISSLPHTGNIRKIVYPEKNVGFSSRGVQNIVEDYKLAIYIGFLTPIALCTNGSFGQEY